MSGLVTKLKALGSHDYGLNCELDKPFLFPADFPPALLSQREKPDTLLFSALGIAVVPISQMSKVRMRASASKLEVEARFEVWQFEIQFSLSPPPSSPSPSKGTWV